MATPTLVNNVAVYITSSGAGAFTLGAAVIGYRGLEALTNGNTYSYSVRQDALYEVGRGTYLSAGKQLVRSPKYSSSGGSPVAFTANAVADFVLLAEDVGSGGGAAYIPPSGQLVP
jgi:hypothetical protein